MSQTPITTHQYVDLDAIRNGQPVTESRRFTFTTIDHVNLRDTSVLSITVEWTHGIYATKESARFTVVSTCNGEDVLVHENGKIETMDNYGPQFEGNTLHMAISRHISETV